MRRGSVAALWGFGLAVLLGVPDFAQSRILDPSTILPAGAALVIGVTAVAFAAGAGLLALVGRMAPGRAVLIIIWLAAVVLAVTGVVDLVLSSSLPRATLLVLAVPLLLPVFMRGASLPTHVALAWSIVALLLGARHAVGLRCVVTEDRTLEARGAEGGTRPNVVLVVLDALRADHLSGYGYPAPTSPAIDALGETGVFFSRAYAQSSWTRPATASLLTSLYPSQHAHGWERDTALSETLTTLPELLRDAGYATAAFSGNTHVTPEAGFAQGFETFQSCDDAGRGRTSLLLGVWKWTDALLGHLAPLTGNPAPLRFWRAEIRVDGVIGNGRSDVILVRAFERWLRRTDPDRPFFAYLHLMSPHVQYDPSAESRRLLGASPTAVVRSTPPHTECFGAGGEIPPAQRRELLALYDATIRDGDGFVGSVVEYLERRGLGARTMVVVTADHGEEFFDHGNWGHGQSLYEELTRIPLVIRRPFGREAGRRHDTPVMAVDVMPTILAEAGVPIPRQLVGRSLIDRGDERVHDVVFSQLLKTECAGWAVVAGDWKYFEWEHGGSERKMLFDLERDPAEQAAMAVDGRQDLVQRLEQHRRQATRIVSQAQTDSLNAQQVERLRALGYVR